MNVKIEAMKAIAKLFEAVTNVDECKLGAPLNPGPGDNFITLEWDTDHDLNESGGVADETTVLTLFSVIGEIGIADTPMNLVTELDARITAFKALLEEDVTLNDIVSQVRIKKSTVQAVPTADNNWEAGCRIELEVKEW